MVWVPNSTVQNVLFCASWWLFDKCVILMPINKDQNLCLSTTLFYINVVVMITCFLKVGNNCLDSENKNRELVLFQWWFSVNTHDLTSSQPCLIQCNY
jgi:hypothetical protein